MAKIKRREPISVFLLSLFTLGIYSIYWLIKTKDEINRLGANIPTGWLLIIPIVNFYWMYKYAEGFSEKVVKDKSPALWFVLLFFGGFIALPIFQYELNKK